MELTRPKWCDEPQRSGRTIEVDWDLRDVSLVRGTSSELRRLITNLVFNAVDAMPSGGRICLRLRQTRQFVMLEVVDTGTGMSEEVRSRCFEPFFTTKGDDGTGLGLSICYGIVQRHMGRIEVDGVEGHGTVVRVFLPISGQASQEVPAEFTSPLPRRRVLVIDDDAGGRNILSALLKHVGQQVATTSGGAEGLREFQSQRYDLVITDLGMPEMSGRQVIHAVKEARLSVPVVLLSGWGSPFVTEGAGEGEEPDYFLGKPPTLSSLRGLLERLRTQLETP
jgi:CheY-like chemotaxis protein